MNRNYTLIFILWLCTFSAAYGQTVYIDNGSSNTYTLVTGDSLYISGGTFTGKIIDQSQGAKITVAASAGFKPSSVNAYHSVYQIYGTAFFSANISGAQGFGLDNHGTITFNGNLIINNSVLIFNDTTGIINIRGTLTINKASTLINEGEIIIGSTVRINGNSGSYTNHGNLLMGSDFIINNTDGQFQNEGYLYAKGNITSNVAATITNTCRMVSGKNFIIHSGTVYNSGLLWSSDEQNASVFTNNSGTIISLDQGIIKSEKFTNNGTLKGNGFLYLTGQTTANGTIGEDGNTTDTLKVYTVNRNNPNKIFDNEWGTLHPNVIYAPFAAPDTLTSSNYPCYEKRLQILPFEWKDFSLMVIGNNPLISWSAQRTDGVRFEVQRSNTGKDFSFVSSQLKQQVAYKFEDRTIDLNQTAIVYYRVKASLPDGKESYTEVKMLRLPKTVSLKPIRISPNPFSSSMQIDYQSPAAETIAIKVVNLQGQVQYYHRRKVEKGNNPMFIAESAAWGNGIYLVSIYGENGLSASTKVIKQ